MLKSTTYAVLNDYYCHRIELQEIKQEINTIIEIMIEAFQKGKKVLICGNGGSSADADHIVGELVKSFKKSRTLPLELCNALNKDIKYGSYLLENLQDGLPVINLGAHTSLLTAMINDVGGEFIFAQQVVAYGQPDDILIGISTSGNSKNILYAGAVAKAKGMHTIGLTGANGGKMVDEFHYVLKAPSNVTEDVQDIHSMIYHVICAGVEEELW